MAETGAIKSADRVLAILGYVAERQPVRFAQLIAEFELPRSSAHGLLQTMVARGWLEHDPQLRSYSLGLRAWQVGQRYTGNGEVADVAKPEMDRLAALVGETVQLARLIGVENVYLAISEAPRPIRLASSVGVRLPAWTTGLGKVLLAQLSPAEVQRRFHGVELRAYTSHTLTSMRALEAKLAEVRECGFALDEEEYMTGICCTAVPLTSTGSMHTALSITAPTGRRGADWPHGYLELLHASADRIRTSLGMRG